MEIGRWWWCYYIYGPLYIYNSLQMSLYFEKSVSSVKRESFFIHSDFEFQKRIKKEERANTQREREIKEKKNVYTLRLVIMFGTRRNSARIKKLDRNELWQDVRVEFDLSKM